MQRQRKGIIGDFLGSVVEAVSGGIPIVGGKLGNFVAGQARRLPFRKGGLVMATHMMPDGSMMKGKTHGAKKKKAAMPAKGSAAMKQRMARLRAMRK
jgi:hypothetical protein